MVTEKEIESADGVRRAAERQHSRRVPPADERASRARRGAEEQARSDQKAGELAHAGCVPQSGRAGRRWYYTARDGLLHFVDVTDDAARKLERGQAAVVEGPGGAPVGVVGADTAAELEALDPSWVRFRVPARR